MMPTCRAASITSVPVGTCVRIPSIVIVTMFAAFDILIPRLRFLRLCATALGSGRGFPFRLPLSASASSIRTSYSLRQYFNVLCTGAISASPNAQTVRPPMFSQISVSVRKSSGRPCLFRIRWRIWTIQELPSRQGVHFPHDS